MAGLGWEAPWVFLACDHCHCLTLCAEVFIYLANSRLFTLTLLFIVLNNVSEVNFLTEAVSSDITLKSAFFPLSPK